MAAFVDLKPGTRLSLLPDTPGRRFSYDAVVRHVSAQGIRLDARHPDDEPLDIEPGDAVTLLLQLHGRMYTLSTRVKLVEHAPIEVIVIERPRSAQRAERREFFRLLTSLTPRYVAHLDDDGEELKRLEAQVTDISGGGLQLRTRQQVPIGDRIRVIFSFDGETEEIDVTIVAMLVEQLHERSASFRVNGKFIGLGAGTQEYMIRQIFREQRDLQQRGVI